MANIAPGPVGTVIAGADGFTTAVVADEAAANSYGPAAVDSLSNAYKNTDGTYSVVYRTNGDSGNVNTGSSAPTIKRVITPKKPVATTVTLPKTSLSATAADTATVPTKAADTPTGKALNSPFAGAWQPDAAILVDGVSVGRPIKFEISLNNNRQADRFFITLDLPSMPTGYGNVYWAEGDQKRIEIRVGSLNQTLKPVLIGRCDEVEIDWKTQIVSIHGRDLSALLIDTTTSQKYANQTSSQIAKAIASKYGLVADVDDTTTLVGAFYQREHAQLTDETKEHDLLSYLADQEGFNYWVKLNTLHFRASEGTPADAFVVNYVPSTATSVAAGTWMELTTSRSETLAKDISVKVISWNGKSKRQIVASVRRSRTRATGKLTRDTAGTASTPQQFVFRVPNLTKDQATAYAQNKAREISSHERNIVVQMPPDYKLTPRDMLKLTGTGTAYDQNYFVDAIELDGSFKDGFSMTVHAKNHSPQTETTV